MGKVGRNEPCRCGSGKKYKKCCEARDRKVALERARQHDVEGRHGRADIAGVANALAALVSEEQADLDEVCAHVDELIDAGRLDEAEDIARQIEADYPEEEVGAECLALIYEARGQNQIAADHYRRAIAAMDTLGDGNYCDCCRARLVRAVGRLDPDGPLPELGRDPQ